MSGKYTQSQKKATYKWFENNLEKKRLSAKKYKARKDAWVKVKVEFLNILFI